MVVQKGEIPKWFKNFGERIQRTVVKKLDLEENFAKIIEEAYKELKSLIVVKTTKKPEVNIAMSGCSAKNYEQGYCNPPINGTGGNFKKFEIDLPHFVNVIFVNHSIPTYNTY